MHVDDDFRPRRCWSVPARHERHDRRSQGARRIEAAYCAEQGCRDAAVRCFLGWLRYPDRAVLQCNDDDDHRFGQRKRAEFPARTGPGIRCKRRHHRNRLAGCPHRRPRFAHGRRTADALRRRADQITGPWTRICRRCGARGICACSLWIDDVAGGDGRAGRTNSSGGLARRPRHQLVGRPVRDAGADRYRARADRRDAIIDRGNRRHAVRIPCRSGWT